MKPTCSFLLRASLLSTRGTMSEATGALRRSRSFHPTHNCKASPSRCKAGSQRTLAAGRGTTFAP
eukprot:2414987-Lingulodinium_polyedra.AAC.1